MDPSFVTSETIDRPPGLYTRIGSSDARSAEKTNLLPCNDQRVAYRFGCLYFIAHCALFICTPPRLTLSRLSLFYDNGKLVSKALNNAAFF